MWSHITRVIPLQKPPRCNSTGLIQDTRSPGQSFQTRGVRINLSRKILGHCDKHLHPISDDACCCVCVPWEVKGSKWSFCGPIAEQGTWQLSIELRLYCLRGWICFTVLCLLEKELWLMVIHLDSVTIGGHSDQISETLSTLYEGKDGCSAFDSVNVGLPSGAASWQCEVVPP